ncbi:hypothetical protein NDI39_24100 [Microcoleus sp. ZQ-A2]|nr:hypothetical protein [Microcoleus sp. FACHB-1]
MRTRQTWGTVADNAKGVPSLRQQRAVASRTTLRVSFLRRVSASVPLQRQWITNEVSQIVK